jgi:RNA polymerase sigma factor (TIGR02999 family)
MSALPHNVTQLLLEWRRGNHQALDQLMPLVYDELRRLAQHYMRSERPDHTLQATALVNEAYLRLVDSQVSWQDRAHFFAVAARLMRRILVDHAKARRRSKRGSGGAKVSLDDALDVAVEPAVMKLQGRSRPKTHDPKHQWRLDRGSSNLIRNTFAE